MSLVLSGTNGLSDVDGTAATPAIRGTDANTGIFFPAADTIAFAEGGAEAMRIDSSGNVGIGTASPSALLHVRKDQTAATYIMADNQGTVNAATSSGFACAEGGSVTAFFRTLRDATGIAQLFNTSASPLTFGTNNTERARIDSSGSFRTYAANPIITGTSNAADATTANAIFQGRYSATSTTGGGTNCIFITSNGNIYNTNAIYGTLSDAKLKENIVDATSQWNDIKALRVRNFNFKEGQTHTQIGYIAQEVEAVSPSLVDTSQDVDAEGNELGTTTKSLKLSVINIKAVKALQENMVRTESLETLIQEQQALITTLTDRITALEAK
jgi:hypothetical protein